MKPLVGVVTRGRIEQEKYSVNTGYCDAVRRAGGDTIFFPPGSAEPAELLKLVEAAMFIGGGDVHPDLFGGKMLPEVRGIDPERDETEIAFARLLATRTIPTLAICRGIQVVNVALGGTLYEHVPDAFGSMVPHQAEGTVRLTHEVEVVEGSHLAEALRTRRFSVRSDHHQAVQNLAPGLRVTARSDDGLIEAFEKPDHPWFVGVQWHPELSAAEDPVQQRLFDALVNAAARK